MTVKLYRKTHAMLVLEYKNSRRPIDLLILDALIDSHGEYRSAARKLNLSPSTLTRWIQQLELVSDAARIRQQYGLPTIGTYGELHVQSTESGLKFTDAILGDCTDCHANIKELAKPLEIVRFTEKSRPRGLYVVVRDINMRLHWFAVNKAKLIEKDDQP